MSDKANILVLGPADVGKSTLINAVIGKNVAKESYGKRRTEKMEAYESDDLSFRLIDSRGYDDDFWNTQKSVREMQDWMKAGLRNKKPRIHMLWLCVDATSRGISNKTMKVLERVKSEWKDIPVIVVLTKSFFPDEDKENIEMVKAAFRNAVKKTGMPKAIVPVLARAPKGMDIVPRGIEDLVKATEDNIDEAFKDSEAAVSKYDLKCKRMYAQALTAGATTSAAAIGAIPIGIPDSALLTALETGLITGISKIYNLDQTDELTKTIGTRIIEAGAVSMAAKAAINQLKLIPGVANLAADVLNSIVAGTIVFGIGEATSIIMEKVYLGDIDKENLDWVNNIVKGQVGTVITKITQIVAASNGKIDVKEILNALISKKQ